MREKYVEARFPRYMVFGEHADGRVDVASVNGDIVCGVTREDADRVIRDRNDIVNMLVELSLAFDEADPDRFSALWYGSDRG